MRLRTADLRSGSQSLSKLESQRSNATGRGKVGKGIEREVPGYLPSEKRRRSKHPILGPAPLGLCETRCAQAVGPLHRWVFARRDAPGNWAIARRAVDGAATRTCCAFGSSCGWVVVRWCLYVMVPLSVVPMRKRTNAKRTNAKRTNAETTGLVRCRVGDRRWIRRDRADRRLEYWPPMQGLG
jgi:hypothetical protein